jgi:siderophore synthetase component
VIREKVSQYEWRPSGENGGTYILKAAFNRKVLVPVKNTYQLGHMDIDGQVLLVDDKGHMELSHPVQFLTALFETCETSNELQTLLDELDNSITNDAIALTAKEYRKMSETQPSETGVFETLLKMKNEDPFFSPLVYLEQWATEGHTIHPCSKTRIGLSPEESKKYSPEWGTEVRLVLLAVHKSESSSSSMGDQSLTDLLLSEYPYISEEMEELDSYVVIPVHPWQYEHTIKKHYREELDKRLIIPLDSVIPVKPLLSFRSMAPSNGRKFHHIKTAVNIQMTSAKRLVSPASVHNGPVISRLLKELEKTDPLLKGKVVFLPEVAGSYFSSRRTDPFIDLEKNLSCLIRENPEADLAYNELAIPAASLINTLPFSTGTLMKDLITEYAKENKLTTEESAAEYLELYAKALLPCLVHLVVQYGISLEAHLQNAMVVFKDGKPVKLMLRDNGGIRIHKGRSSHLKETAEIDNTTNLLTDRLEDLYQMFSHAVLHNHLGEIIVKLTKELTIKESDLWAKVKEVLIEIIMDIRSQTSYKQEASQFELYVLGPHTYLKALLKMRLNNSVIDNMYVAAPNPLVTGTKGEIE